MSLTDIAGFPEFSVEDEIIMQRTMRQIKSVYEQYGYVPMETRLVEYADILEQKGIDGKEVYALGRLHNQEIDQGKETKKVLALRFDLTVPLARYVAQHAPKLLFPFKRYQVQKVYRGESAKEASGRFREFYQSDIDVIGSDTLDIRYDCEFPAIIYDIFTSVLGIDRFTMRINNRKLLEGLFAEAGVAETNIKRAVKVIDNMEKVPVSATKGLLVDLALDSEKADALLKLFKLCRESHPVSVVQALSLIPFRNPVLLEGVSELRQVIEGIAGLRVPASHFRVDPSIARGLDYYTGTVYETTLTDMPQFGSVCSGGRYEELVGTLASSGKYPGSGVSIGLSRLVTALIQNGILKAETKTTGIVLVTVQDRALIDQYQGIASEIRKLGVPCSVYYNDAKLKKQLRYASSAGFRYVVIANKDELAANTINVKDLSTGKQTTESIFNLRSDTFPYFLGKGRPKSDVSIPALQDPIELSGIIKEIMGMPK